MPDTIAKPVSALIVGDLVDLEGDAFADPTGSNVQFLAVYQTVASIERETADCIAVGFESFDVVGFPLKHHVRVPSGAVGCVSRNYKDRKWRIACDPRPFEEQPTFKTRDEAATAEWHLIQSLTG